MAGCLELGDGFLLKKGEKVVVVLPSLFSDHCVQGIVKTGLTQALRKRWFFMDPNNDGKLFYCTSEDAVPKGPSVVIVAARWRSSVIPGHIDLRDALSVRAVDVAPDKLSVMTSFMSPDAHRFAFEITTKSRVWLLYAESEERRRYWMEGLRSVRSEGRAPPLCSASVPDCT